MPKKVRPVIYVPAEHEISKLMRHVKDKEIEILAAYGGMRRGEIAALDASDINGNIVHVKCAMVETDQNDWKVKSPKSYAGDRFIQYPDFVLDKLPKMGKITPLNPTMISQRFGRVVKSAGLPAFRFHNLRHYHASTLHALGVPDQYIMEKCGWSNDSVLKDVYRHTIQDVKEKINAVSDDYFKKMQHEMQHEKNKPQNSGLIA